MPPAIAIITAPRPNPTFAATVEQIRWGGFTGDLHVFAEPGSVVPESKGLLIRRHSTRLGMWRNWLFAARSLLRHTTASQLLILEDDLSFARGAAVAWQESFGQIPAGTLGYWTLYTPEHNTWGQAVRSGWQALSDATVCWGSLALAFSRESLSSLLHTRTINLHARPNETDYVLWQAAQEAGRKIYFHTPSLCSHTGQHNSTVGNYSTPSTRAVGFDPYYTPAPEKLRLV